MLCIFQGMLRNFSEQLFLFEDFLGSFLWPNILIRKSHLHLGLFSGSQNYLYVRCDRHSQCSMGWHCAGSCTVWEDGKERFFVFCYCSETTTRNEIRFWWILLLMSGVHKIAKQTYVSLFCEHQELHG